MLADNDEGALELVALDLRLEGHDVLAAVADGEAAVAACAEHRPEVLVVDYRMPPGIDGVEASRRVREAGTVGRIVLYSNYRDPAVERAAARLGALWLPKGDLRALRRAVADDDLTHGPARERPGW